MAHFRLQRAGEGFQRALAGQVGGKQWDGHLGGEAGNIHHMAMALVEKTGQQFQGHGHGADVVQLHGALIVVQAVQGLFYGATDGMGCIVHQRIDTRLLGENPSGAGLDGHVVAQVAGVDKGVAAVGFDEFLDFPQLLFPPRYQTHGGAPARHDFRCLGTDATGGAGQYDGLSFQFHDSTFLLVWARIVLFGLWHAISQALL